MSSAVDVVVAGHSHSRINVRVPNADGSGDKLDRRGALLRRGLRPGGHPRRHAHRRGGVEVGGDPGHRPRRGGGRRRRGRARRALPRARGAAGESGGRRDAGTAHARRRRARTARGRAPSGRSRETDVAVVKPVSLRADIDAGAGDLRRGRGGARVRPPGGAGQDERPGAARADRATAPTWRAPSSSIPMREYSVAASEMIAGARPRGRHRAAGARLVPCTLSHCDRH